MDVIIDGKRGYAFTHPPADAFAAVAAIMEALQTEGRALLGISVDGKDIVPEKLREALEGKQLSEVATLDIRTGNIAALVRDTLAELEATAPELPNACHEMARVFQGADPNQGYEPFQHLAELWGQIKAREKQVAVTLGVQLDDVKVDGKSFASLHDDLNAILEEAARALESGDLILLGDLLEYELAARAETEMQIISLLKDRSQQRAS